MIKLYKIKELFYTLYYSKRGGEKDVNGEHDLHRIEREFHEFKGQYEVTLKDLNKELNLLAKRIKKMSTKYDAIKVKLDDLTLSVDNVVVEVNALKAQLEDTLTLDELNLVTTAIDEQKAKINAVL